MKTDKTLVYRGSGSDLATDIMAMLPAEEVQRLLTSLPAPATPPEAGDLDAAFGEWWRDNASAYVVGQDVSEPRVIAYGGFMAAFRHLWARLRSQAQGDWPSAPAQPNNQEAPISGLAPDSPERVKMDSYMSSTPPIATAQKCDCGMPPYPHYKEAPPIATEAPAPTLNLAPWGLNERRDALNILRQVCERFGDNDFPDDLHLGDAIEKHLWNHLEGGEAPEKGAEG